MKLIVSCALALGVSLLLSACGGDGGGAGASSSPAATDPATPSAGATQPETTYRLLGQVAVEQGTFADFAVVGNRLFVAAGSDGIRIFDITDLQNPKQVGAVSPYSASPYAPDQVQAIAASGNVAVASVNPGCYGSCWIDFQNGGELRVYDISTPESPRQIATIPKGAAALALQGSRLFALDGTLSLMFGDGTTSPQTTLRVIDLAAPDAPRLVTTASVNRSYAFALNGNRIFLGYAERAGNQSGVQEVDISPSGQVTSVAANGDAPADVSRSEVVEASGMLYTATGLSEFRIYPLDGLKEQVPKLVALPKAATGIAASAGKLYVTQEGSGVSVFGLDTPLAPVPFKVIPVDGKAASVRVYPSFGIVHLGEERTDGMTGSLIRPERIQFFSISN